jgi:hypothetical protein
VGQPAPGSAARDLEKLQMSVADSGPLVILTDTEYKSAMRLMNLQG